MAKRIEKINELIRQELATIMSAMIDLPLNCLLTITRVDTEDNLKTAQIYISIFPTDKSQGVLKILAREVGAVQRALNKRLYFKWTPRITFKLDASQEIAGLPENF